MKTEQIQIPNPPAATAFRASYHVQGHKLWRLRAFTLAVTTVTATRLIARMFNTSTGEDRMIAVGYTDLNAASSWTVQGGILVPPGVFLGNENVAVMTLPDMWHTLDGDVRLITDANDAVLTSVFITLEYDD